MFDKSFFVNHLKNGLGRRTSKSKKVLIFLVDDYGNVRIDGVKAYDHLKKQGYITNQNRFDKFDTLETTTDLEQLFEVLNSVKDNQGNVAVFTPMALAANPDFNSLSEYGYDRYRYETVDQTFARKASEEPKAYQGAWALVHEGIRAGIFCPQFHGREHLNVQAFNSLLQKRNPKLLASLAHRSLIGGNYPAKSDLLVAFDFFKAQEIENQKAVVEEGVSLFEQSYGYTPKLFTAPGYRYHNQLEKALAKSGIKAIDTFFTGKEHQGEGHYLRKWHLHGQFNSYGQVYMLRNVVFEPTSVQQETGEVVKALKEIEIAFRWGKPAVISSHRVNFCGHIDPANRKRGLNALLILLKGIVKKWPDVEFWSGGKLVGQLTIGNEN